MSRITDEMRKQGEAFDNEFPDSGLGMNSLQYNKIKPFISSSTKSVLEVAAEEVAKEKYADVEDMTGQFGDFYKGYNSAVDDILALLRESAK